LGHGWAGERGDNKKGSDESLEKHGAGGRLEITAILG
jgi:hypothetical protein